MGIMGVIKSLLKSRYGPGILLSSMMVIWYPVGITYFVENIPLM